MTVLAKKHKLVGILYAFTTILGLYFAISSYNDSESKIFIIGLVMFLVSIIILIRYIKTPNEPIKLNENNELVLNNKDTFLFSQVLDISYKRASAKGIQYKWGKVIIKTIDSEYMINYIANCEQVAKDITKLKYELQMSELR